MKKYILATALIGGIVATYGFVKTSDATTGEKASQGNVLTPGQEKEVENIIQTYLKENPKVVMQAVEAAMTLTQLEEQQKLQQAVADNQDKLFKDARSPIGGNPQGKEELVVFMDPYCGFCKKFHSELDKALESNTDLKVVFKDIAIMGPGSNIAVLAMLAAAKQGKYKEMQEKVFEASDRLSKKELLREATVAGLNAKTLEQDMDSEDVRKLAEDTMTLAKDLGVNGTPTFIIGETVHPGFVPADQLNQLLKGQGQTSAQQG